MSRPTGVLFVRKVENIMNTTKISISVFFPCHNEQDNITPLVDKTLGVLSTISDDYEIIIVNDGSTDDTARVAEQLVAQNEQVKLVSHPVNRGYGGVFSALTLYVFRDYCGYYSGINIFCVNLGLFRDCFNGA